MKNVQKRIIATALLVAAILATSVPASGQCFRRASGCWSGWSGWNWNGGYCRAPVSGPYCRPTAAPTCSGGSCRIPAAAPIQNPNVPAVPTAAPSCSGGSCRVPTTAPACSGGSCRVPTAATAAASPQNIIDRVIAAMNAARADEGYAPVRFDAEISKGATEHSRLMARWRSCFHANSPYPEICASWQETPEFAVQCWLKSRAGHREEVLNPSYNVAGVGVATDGAGRYYWVVRFGRKAFND